jgi:long-subunit acyl-CoA synthetase (AMP-forming)
MLPQITLINGYGSSETGNVGFGRSQRGGEKVFVEEVETVLRAHPGVADALVVGWDSDRWGQEFVFVDKIRRLGNGKADYRWAKSQAAPRAPLAEQRTT